MAQNDRGITRIESKLKAALESGSYYEAHQMYRTLYYRYLRQQKYPDLLKLLNDGAALLLKHDQQGSGVDLAILLIDVLEKSATKPSEDWIERLSKLFVLISPSLPERDTFITTAIKWSLDANKRGHPLLHQRIAEQLIKEKKYNLAHRHLMHSGNGEAYANLLILMNQEQMENFKDTNMVLLQAALRLLCLRNTEMASVTFKTYTSNHPVMKKTGVPLYKDPLLDDIWRLIKCVEEKDLTQFLELRKHLDCTGRDIEQYLNKIGKYYFDIEPQTENRRPNLLSNLLNSMMNEGGDSSGDETDGKPSQEAVKTTDYDLD